VAKPDKADEVSTFLADALRLANQEQGSIAWFALRTDTATFWIVDAFPSDGERQAHLEGAIASSLLPMQNDSLTGHQRSSRPRSSPPSCRNRRAASLVRSG
jgi:hypothetical protein